MLDCCFNTVVNLFPGDTLDLSTDSSRVAQFDNRPTATTSSITTRSQSPFKTEPVVAIPNEVEKIAKTARRHVTNAAEDLANSV